MKKLGIGIIGTGAIAAKHAKAIESLSGAELLAICSFTADRALAAAEKFGVPGYSDLDAFLAHPGIQIVTICTASGKHLEPAMKAAKQGKHLFIEKPIEINLKRADQLINTARQYKVKLEIVYQNRFSSGFVQLKNAVKDGKLGKLLMGNAYINWFRKEEYYSSSDWKGTLIGDGGGALINQGIHTIDLLLDIMGEVASVNGKVKTVFHQIEGEDLGAALVNFRSGAIGTITGGTSLYPGYPERLEIYGSEGSVIIAAGKIINWNIKGEVHSSMDIIQHPIGTDDPMAVGHLLHVEQYQNFLTSIRENHEPIVTGEIARKSLELIRAIYASSDQNREVKFGEDFFD
jgi:UDP-N-acetyl-2-amino-2-deoxyglucuronate dehydrogenase